MPNGDLYDTFLVSTYYQPELERLKEALLDLAGRTLDDPLRRPESDRDHEAQHEIAIAYCDRIRHFLVEGTWPGDEQD